MKTLTGVTEAHDLNVSKEFEIETQREIERLLPGSWVKIREICVTAKDLKFRQSASKIADIRSGIRSCHTYAEKAFRAFNGLPEAAKSLISRDAHNKLSELVASLELALAEALDKNGFPDGKVAYLYREYIATHLVKIMREHEVEPKMNRDINHTSTGDDTYAQLVRLAIELTDDGVASPTELMKIMKQGLDSNILKVNQVPFP